jgi:hypothetical protein
MVASRASIAASISSDAHLCSPRPSIFPR